jgi:hypothetical protein
LQTLQSERTTDALYYFVVVFGPATLH